MDPIKANTIEFLRNRSRKAFEFLYLLNEREFKRYAGILTGGQYAEDLVQLVCLQLLEYDGAHKNPDEFNFKKFFCRSLHNTLINLYRTRKPSHLDIDEIQIADPGPDTENDYKPLILHIEKFLTWDQRDVMYLRMKGVMFKDIAKIKNINSNTATGMFRYGRMKLAPYKEKILNL